MNRIFIIITLLITINCNIYADKDKSIKIEELPQNAQVFIKNYFPDIEVSFAKTDNEIFDRNYEVFFVNGCKVEFDRKGNWIDVDCKFMEVPAEIIPSKIRDFLAKHHKNNKVIKISKEDDYEVEIDTGIELKFDLKYNFRGYDD